MEKFTKLRYSEIETRKESEFETSFVVQPLERGFANTLGNVLRRVLLSSVSGVAPIAIKINGVDHEFQSIKGVKEDVVQLILNLKDIRFVYNEEVFVDGEITRISLSSKQEGEITAKDLTLPAGVQLVDENSFIANIAKGGSLELEIFLISGRGFKSFEENKILIKDFGSKIESKIKNGLLISMDSDFSPVVNVSYKSEELNSASANIEEKLTIKIKTDGSVEAKNAIAQAAHILMSHLQILSNVGNITKDEIFKEQKVEEQEQKVDSVPITSLDLSVRSYNCLKRSNILTLDQLAKLTVDELENIQNLGRKSVEEIIQKLKDRNIELKEGE